jgi:hypothetical protein
MVYIQHSKPIYKVFRCMHSVQMRVGVTHFVVKSEALDVEV